MGKYQEYALNTSGHDTSQDSSYVSSAQDSSCASDTSVSAAGSPAKHAPYRQHAALGNRQESCLQYDSRASDVWNLSSRKIDEVWHIAVAGVVARTALPSTAVRASHKSQSQPRHCCHDTSRWRFPRRCRGARQQQLQRRRHRRHPRGERLQLGHRVEGRGPDRVRCCSFSGRVGSSSLENMFCTLNKQFSVQVVRLEFPTENGRICVLPPHVNLFN